VPKSHAVSTPDSSSLRIPWVEYPFGRERGMGVAVFAGLLTPHPFPNGERPGWWRNWPFFHADGIYARLSLGAPGDPPSPHSDPYSHG
jgi:hypothetical protein